ncbi:MAG: C39 family peptidase [Anaerolineae bacterium]|nr:C39 family peptidase [Anaerolineae bacterium]
MQSGFRFKPIYGFIAIAAVIFMGAVYLFLLNPRIQEYQTARYYETHPPQEQVFTPVGVDAEPGVPQLDVQVKATPVPTRPDVVVHEEDGAELPDAVLLEGVTYTHQHGKWNYCAPANLTMALSYWGVNQKRDDVAHWLKPFDDDKNVNPDEMVAYVEAQTPLHALSRVGGTLDVVKRLVANGYPVLIEKGEIIVDVSTGIPEWAGHYAIVVGYDDTRRVLVTHDSYYSPPDYPLNFEISYREVEEGWAHFNNTFIVVYPPYEELTVYRLLSGYADPLWAVQTAYQQTREGLLNLSGVDLYFSAYHFGTNQMLLGDYRSAAFAYDEAFRIYAQLETDTRPWRTMWYLPGAYEAYFNVGRYQDVINLATHTIESTPKPYFEESWYWRGIAYAALGDVEAARSDLEQALKYNENYQAAQTALSALD